MKISRWNKWLVMGAGLLLVAVSILVVLGLQYTGSTYSAAEFPTQGWRSSTPEEHGVDSEKLADGLLALHKNGVAMHSLMLVRDGEVILEAYSYPYSDTIYHDVASVTKSLLTTLVGIAADQGKLDLDQSVLSFFPNRTIANRDARKERITVRHLVSMSSGLDCTYADDEKTLQEMRTSPDWVQFVLDRKMVWEPGEHFVYCSPGMHLLSAILQEATGMSALEFARANLFEPLGIQDVYWPADPQGYNHGWGDAALHPKDMAKIGLLFLRHGRWEDRQIVSRQWVEQATRSQIGTQGHSSEDYGYGWWTSASDSDLVFYYADGRDGQRIALAPAWNLVIVATGGGFDCSEFDPYLLAAIHDSSRPLPANPAGVERLKAAAAEAALVPAAQPVAPLPEIASAISGKTFIFKSNPLQARSARIDFDASAEATFYLDLANESAPRIAGVGLDGVYRLSHSGRPSMAWGRWKDANTFVIEYSEGPGLTFLTISMRFEGERLFLKIGGSSLPSSVSLEGEAKK